MKVYVIYDPLYERVMSVHKKEENAKNRCLKNDKDQGRDPHEYDEYELEE